MFLKIIFKVKLPDGRLGYEFLWALTCYHPILQLCPASTLLGSLQNYLHWAEFGGESISLNWGIL